MPNLIGHSLCVQSCKAVWTKAYYRASAAKACKASVARTCNNADEQKPRRPDSPRLKAYVHVKSVEQTAGQQKLQKGQCDKSFVQVL